MKPYRTIEHTADIGIEVSGSSLEEFFVHAAQGTIDLVVDALGAAGPESGAESIKNISLQANIKEQLLVKWLEELLYLFEIRQLVPVRFEINSISDTKLSARVVSVPFSPEMHRPKYQIKAVTYHNLTIVEKDGRFSAIIIFDI